MFMSVSMDSEPSVNQDTDLEIEGGVADTESIDPGVVECMEVEEEEDVNGDVIRCLCNESEEGGFMIQVIIRFRRRKQGRKKVSVKVLLHSETKTVVRTFLCLGYKPTRLRLSCIKTLN